MSRLTEIFDNHTHIDELGTILKHYGVNAQFAAEAIAMSFEQLGAEEGNEEETANANANTNANAETEAETNNADATVRMELIEDLRQYIARL